MKIILSPIANSYTTEISLNELILTIDGQEIDLSVIPVGGQAEADENSPFLGLVTREQVTIKYFYDSLKAESKQSTNIEDYTFEVAEGIVPNPIVWKPSEEVEDV